MTRMAIWVVSPFRIGTVVNVYLLHSDPIGEPRDPRVYFGSITFPFRILGVIATGRRLRFTDSRLGNPGTQYAQSDTYRGYELGDWSRQSWGPERFRISPDGYTLEFVCGTTTVVDELRILTAVPEPASLLALSAGVAGLVGLRRLEAMSFIGQGQVTLAPALFLIGSRRWWRSPHRGVGTRATPHARWLSHTASSSGKG
jgi:hypothetical protein